MSSIRPDVVEAADSAANTATAYTLSVGQTGQGTISSPGDHDWYRIVLTAGQTYTFAEIGTGTNSLNDPFLNLRNSSGTAVASNDDSGPGQSASLTYTAPTSGTYYIDAGSYADSGAGQYGITATLGTRPNFDIPMGAGAIDAHAAWSAPGTGVTITYGFRQSAAGYSAGGSNISTFSQVSAAEMAAIQSILQLWSDVANITFSPVNPGGYTNSATILIANYSDASDGAGAFAFYPGSTSSTSSAGDLWLNLSGGVSTSSVPVGSYSFFAIMHELGHALGLSHPGDYNAAPGVSITYSQHAQFTQDTEQYSVMSYFGGSNTGESPGGFASGYTPMMFDIYELQNLYGANYSTRASDTVYGFGSTAGSIYSFSATASAYCIWDGGGNDTLNCSGYSQNELINLNEGTFSNIGGGTANISIALGVTIESAIGGSGSDTITGNAANNVLRGGGGNDTIDGRSGTDTAVFSGLRSSYTLTDLGGNSVRVSGPDGVDVLSNVEFLQFDDKTVAWPAIPDLTAGLQLVGTTASDTIRNIGSGDAAASLAAIYLSTDSTITTSDTLLSSHSVPLLSGESSNDKTGTLALPTNLTPGTYYLGAIADINAQVAESDELNNVSNVIAIILGNNSVNTLTGTAADDRIIGLGGNDALNGGNGADTLTGGTGADKFIFDASALAQAQSGIIDRVTDYDQSAGAYNLAEGDQFDFSAFLSSPYNHGSGQAVTSLVRAIASGAGANLQVDVDGAANGVNWVTVARIDGIHSGDRVNVILDASLPAGTAISVLTPRQENDYDGDGRSDIVLRHQSGGLYVWEMNGFQIDADGRPAPLDSHWQIIDSNADFDGDGKSDILLRHDNGALYIWEMNGWQLKAQGSPGPIDSHWHVASVADFDGDGKSDILLQHESGWLYLWEMDGLQIKADGRPGPVDSHWRVAGTADFDGDGKSDILMRHESGGLYIWEMNGLQIKADGSPAPVNSDWQVASTSDFDGDGKGDILLRHDSGALYLFEMNGLQIKADGSPGAIDSHWHVASTSDFDGDGKSDILLQHESGWYYLWEMNGLQIKGDGRPAPVDNHWRLASTADFDGDGKSDILLQHESGAVYLWEMNGLQIKADGSPGPVNNDWHIL